MKELSIEEKAKRYDKAIEIINDYYQKIKYSSLSNASTDREVLKSAFPELKESKDEMIRKALIDYFRWNPNSQLLNEFTNREVFAWLEKQGEKKSLDDIAKEVIKDKDAAISFLKSCGIMNENGELADEYKIDQGEQKLIEQDTETRDLWEYIREFRDKFGRLPKDEDELAACIDYVIKRQKPAEWSEEDEATINFLISHFCVSHCNRSFQFSSNKVITYDELLEKIRNLRPQNKWKPSDEQMEALWSATEKYLESDNENVRKLKGEVLESLYENLKKLKKE